MYYQSPTPPPAVCDVVPTASDAAVAASTAVGATSAAVVNSMDCMQNNADATQTPAFSGKRRHSALSSDGAVPIKRPWGSDSHERRPSGATALYGMNNRLDDFTDAFREAFSGGKTGVDATPSRKMRAMKRAQDLETTLSDKRIVALIDLFQADVSVADAYLSLTHDGVREAWVQARTKHITEDNEDEDDFYA
jgi:hypothetical protein